jgi:NAD(P)-dependent dehydrogenase (short-subunit alcohol dehydrogenase family)
VRVLITGGNSWIAQALAIDRNARGDEVFLTASSEASLSALQATCRDRGIAASCAVLDLRHPEPPAADLAGWLATTDGLVLNAATPVRTLDRFHHLPPDEVDASIDADIKGNLFLLRQALPGMVERRFGRIVFVSSVSVVMGTARYGAYCLTKSAMEGLMLTLAVEYGASNVLSNTVRLGIFKTPRTEPFWSRDRYRKSASALIPQGSLGDVDALPEAIHPLLSPRQYINGSVVTVAGGLPLVNTLALPRRTDT